MNIAICDDEALCREATAALVEAYAQAHPEHHVTYSVFEWTEDVLEASGKCGGFDIYLLDIVMQGDMNGIRLGKELRERGYNGKILYLTSSEEYAIDSFRVKAFDYIMKPAQKDRLFRTLNEACETIEQQDRAIPVKTKEGSVKVHFDTILYAELQKRAIVYTLVGGQTVESTTIRSSFTDAVAPLLEDRRFALCGASTVANLAHVTAVENEAIVFRNKQRIYLGKRACRELRFVWNEFHFTERS